MTNMNWKETSDRAFNWYFNAVRKGESYDDAADLFITEVAEQAAICGLEFDYSWQEECSPKSLWLIIEALATRLKGLNEDQGYPVSSEFYGTFFSFFSDLIFTRSQENPEAFAKHSSYWNDVLWHQLPVNPD